MHEIEHHVFQSWQVRFKINEIKVNVLSCGHLNSDVTRNEKYLTHLIQCVIIDPFCSFGNLVILTLEEKNLVRRSWYESCFINHVHLSQGPGCNLLQLIVFTVFTRGINWNSNALPLPVEDVNFVVEVIVKAPLRKVLSVSHMHWYLAVLGHFLGDVVVYEVMVNSFGVVE